jgi:hypothetical protein
MLQMIILGLVANAFSQAINIVIQILSLQLYLLYLDMSTYGTWIMLSAVPSYLSMADFGMVPHRMTMAIGRSDAAEANRVVQSAQLFMMIVYGSLTVLLTLDLISQFFRCRDLLLFGACGAGVSIWLAQRGDHDILWGTKLASKDEIKAMMRSRSWRSLWRTRSAYKE